MRVQYNGLLQYLAEASEKNTLKVWNLFVCNNVVSRSLFLSLSGLQSFLFLFQCYMFKSWVLCFVDAFTLFFLSFRSFAILRGAFVLTIPFHRCTVTKIHKGKISRVNLEMEHKDSLAKYLQTKIISNNFFSALLCCHFFFPI